MDALNLGCGNAKITSAINVDVNPSTKCELTFDIKQKFPLKDESFDRVYLFHTIEHIERAKRLDVMREIRRVMRQDAELIISYPEFSKIVQYWIDNKNCDRMFWEATIYGRQAYPGDYHYSAVHTPEFIEHLNMVGIGVKEQFVEPEQDHNTVLKCYKGTPLLSYEQVLYKEIWQNAD